MVTEIRLRNRCRVRRNSNRSLTLWTSTGVVIEFDLQDCAVLFLLTREIVAGSEDPPAVEVPL